MIKYYPDVPQGGDEWLALRCGILTASEMRLIISPTLKPCNNDKSRSHLHELLAQRITKYVEPRYVSSDMLRGQEDEIEARALYSKHHAPVAEVGFVTNDSLGFPIGYSPDGMVGDDGLIEVKSRCQKHQIETIIGYAVPADFVIQVQTGLLVTERKWLDFISYSGGLPMVVLRVYPDEAVQEAIVEAATTFELTLSKMAEKYVASVRAHRMLATIRKIEQEMFA